MIQYCGRQGGGKSFSWGALPPCHLLVMSSEDQSQRRQPIHNITRYNSISYTQMINQYIYFHYMTGKILHPGFVAALLTRGMGLLPLSPLEITSVQCFSISTTLLIWQQHANRLLINYSFSHNMLIVVSAMNRLF